MSTSACLACGCPDFEILLTSEEVEWEKNWLCNFYRSRLVESAGTEKDLVDFTQKDAAEIRRCLRCATLSRNPQPDPRTLRRRYSQDHYGKEVLSNLAQNEATFFREKASLIAPRLRPAAKVLEVGCFVGAFLQAAHELGWDATGVDVGEETSEFCRSQSLLVLKGTLTELPLEEGDWDAICIWNTFDQINRPGPLLRRARELLGKDGILVLRVPNGLFEIACVSLRRSRRQDRILTAQAYNNFVTFPYLVGYNPGSIAELLTANGFELAAIYGDTILPLANQSFKPEAVREERRYKARVLSLCDRHSALTGELLHPWLDVIAQAA